MTTMAQSLGSQVVQAVGDKIKETLANSGGSPKNKASQQSEALTPEQIIDATFADTQTLVMKQKFETLEVLANAAANFLGLGLCASIAEIPNKYDTYVLNDSQGKSDNNNSQLLLRVVEESEHWGWTGRCLCRPHHQLQLQVSSTEGPQVLQWNRDCKLACCVSCCDVCRQEMTVHHVDNQTPLSKPVAVVKEPILGGLLSPTLQILMERDEDNDNSDKNNRNNDTQYCWDDPTRTPILTLQSTSYCCVGGLCCEHNFEIRDATSGKTVGRLTKEKPKDVPQSLVELVSDADMFTLTYPQDLPSDQKAALLASLHLIEYWLFEGEGDCTMNLLSPQSFAFKLCTLYCCGCICPCGCRRYGRCCWCPMLFG